MIWYGKHRLLGGLEHAAVGALWGASPEDLTPPPRPPVPLPTASDTVTAGAVSDLCVFKGKQREEENSKKEASQEAWKCSRATCLKAQVSVCHFQVWEVGWEI